LPGLDSLGSAQGYGLTLQQGGAALRALGLAGRLEGVGISSTAHYSYSPDGSLLGCYGRRVRQERQQEQRRKADGASANSNGGEKRCRVQVGGDGRANCHVPRQALRLLLHEALLPDTVRWGHRLTRYRSRAGRLLLDFDASGGDAAAQRTYECDVLVGADGIFSAVRAQKLGQGPGSLRYGGCKPSVPGQLGQAGCRS
jgi:salicylate hydroxylase